MPLLRENRYSLNQAAKLVGCDPRVLKRWLAEDLGIITPRVRNGSKMLIGESDLEKLIAKRCDARERVKR